MQVLGLFHYLGICGGSEREEPFEGSIIGEIEQALLTQDRRQGGAARETVEYPGEAHVRAGVLEGRFDLFAAGLEFMGKKIRFDGGEAVEMPTGRGHDGDDVGFEGGLGTELLDVSVEDGVVFGTGFVVEDELAGEEAVADGIAGGAGFAARGDGSAGFGSVGSSGFGAGAVGCVRHRSLLRG